MGSFLVAGMRRARSGAKRGSVMAAIALLVLGPRSADAWFEASEAGPRAMGFAGAFVAVADDASAVYWNPAGLVQLHRHEVLVAFDERTDLTELQNGFAAAAFHLAPVVVGTAWQHTSVTDASTEDLWSLSVAGSPLRRSLGAFLAAGATLKLARIGIEGASLGSLPGLAASATGWAADLGLLVAPIPNVQLGAAYRNLGEPRFDLLSGGSATELRGEFEWGASLRWRRDSWVHLGRVHRDRGASTRVGAELRIGSVLGVRTGFAPDEVAGGADFRLGRWELDTAFRAHEALGTTYRVGLRVAFGPEHAGVGGQFDEF